MTNQNDTQDEAERLAKIWADEHYPHSRTYQTEGTNGWHGFIAGYRAGVASTADVGGAAYWKNAYNNIEAEVTIWRKNMGIDPKIYESLLEENERLKEKLEVAEDMAAGNICGYCLKHDHKDCPHSEQLTASRAEVERLKQELKDALK